MTLGCGRVGAGIGAVEVFGIDEGGLDELGSLGLDDAAPIEEPSVTSRMICRME
jgi:hypothetical protein